jgi:hypothetical protein
MPLVIGNARIAAAAIFALIVAAVLLTVGLTLHQHAAGNSAYLHNGASPAHVATYVHPAAVFGW